MSSQTDARRCDGTPDESNSALNFRWFAARVLLLSPLLLLDEDDDEFAALVAEDVGETAGWYSFHLARQAPHSFAMSSWSRAAFSFQMPEICCWMRWRMLAPTLENEEVEDEEEGEAAAATGGDAKITGEEVTAPKDLTPLLSWRACAWL
jgi:hypothetical protein